MIAWLKQTWILYGTCLKNYLNVKLLDKILNHIALNVIELNWQGFNKCFYSLCMCKTLSKVL